MAYSGFSPHFCHSFPLVGEVPAVIPTKTSDAIYLPKANDSPSKVMENHLPSQPKELLPAPAHAPVVGQHWAAHRACTASLNHLVLPMLLCTILRASGQTGISASSGVHLLPATAPPFIMSLGKALLGFSYTASPGLRVEQGHMDR